MRLPVMLLLLAARVFAAAEDAAIRDLFTKYEQVVDQHQVTLVDDVFTQKFLAEDGGRDGFIKKVTGEPKAKSKANLAASLVVKKGKDPDIYLVRLRDGKKLSSAEFIIVKENGKYKIDGTIDAE